MPAVLFNLWNRYRTDQGTLTFEITQADSFQIHRGSREFIHAAMHALSITANASSWQITPGRSFYYSDYIEDKDWRDRWTRTWRIHVVPEAPLPPIPNGLFQKPEYLSQSDDPSRDPGDDEAEGLRHTAFLIIDFHKSREQIEQTLQSLLAGSEVRATPLEPSIRDLGGGIRQLQLVVHDLDFPADVAALESLLAGFKAADGAVNWRSRRWSAGSSELRAEAAARLAALRRLMGKE
jgi:hypothetical protein